ncbi:YolD-like family protein [Planococcus versutus]|uniref:YolD-like family protein n=1 Tax=Planococcus versutus TaxID=1302659 RepID=A0A1B1S3M5_9BACL|nr:YolD-like family protein [Planococcus versutus]ANU27791.1 hypothetical protein I858_012430 [Planococcus versutus]
MKRNKHLKVVGDIKDRGRIKWTALMLPEHVDMIREWYAKEELVAKPELTDDDLRLLQEELDIAFKRQCEVLIQSWKEGVIYEQRGTIRNLDTNNQVLVCVETNIKYRLPIDEVVGIFMID